MAPSAGTALAPPPGSPLQSGVRIERALSGYVATSGTVVKGNVSAKVTNIFSGPDDSGSRPGSGSSACSRPGNASRAGSRPGSGRAACSGPCSRSGLGRRPSPRRPRHIPAARPSTPARNPRAFPSDRRRRSGRGLPPAPTACARRNRFARQGSARRRAEIRRMFMVATPNRPPRARSSTASANSVRNGANRSSEPAAASLFASLRRSNSSGTTPPPLRGASFHRYGTASSAPSTGRVSAARSPRSNVRYSVSSAARSKCLCNRLSAKVSWTPWRTKIWPRSGMWWRFSASNCLAAWNS